MVEACTPWLCLYRALRPPLFFFFGRFRSPTLVKTAAPPPFLSPQRPLVNNLFLSLSYRPHHMSYIRLARVFTPSSWLHPL